MDTYWLSILGMLALCFLSVALAILSGSSKGFAGALSGPVVPADDNNRLYRIDRVHMNSVEALAPFAVPAVLAMMVGVGPVTLAVLVWAHLAIRLVHLVVYLRGGNAAKAATSGRSCMSQARWSRPSLSSWRDGRRCIEQHRLFNLSAEPSPPPAVCSCIATGDPSWTTPTTSD